MTTKELVHIHQKYKTKSDNTGIAALRKDGELTDNTTEKANIINSQQIYVIAVEMSQLSSFGTFPQI
jgi:hypothetical protein